VKRPEILYISYDGMLEPLGQSQILAYLRPMVARGVAVTLISFEKPADRASAGSVQALRTRLAGQGLRWIVLTYHKRPSVLATSFDLFAGLVCAVVVVLRQRVVIVHARSYVPALIAWLLKRLFGVKFIFDMRGFWADERTEGGLWPPGGRLYRLVKRLERRFLESADEVITLTERARATLQRWPGLDGKRITVIPTCVDLERFPRVRAVGTAERAPTFVYSGSLGTVYLLDEMLRFVEEADARFAGAKFLLLTRDVPETETLRSRTRLGGDRLLVTCVSPAEIPAWLARADAGLAFYKPAWSRQATCPTKIGEYLATGLPVVVNEAVGDMRDIIGANDVGIVLPDFARETYGKALGNLERLWGDPELPLRCRRVAESYFSLDLGVDRYWSVYRRLARTEGSP
jgi:glycosyltransferase involved in cell wall biosynthesis